VSPPLPEGRALPVVSAPAEVLASPAAEVDPCDDDVALLAADLVATMRVSPGCVGLAAPQVGAGRRVFVLDVTGHPRTRTCHGLVVLANPRLVFASDRTKAREGCMSVPDLTGDVKRARAVAVTGRVPGTGEDRTYETDAFEARAFQHEIDHLDGLLFLDRVAGAHAVYARKVYL
jgi:peptide deformylase